MTFPDVLPGGRVELKLGAAWTDITPWAISEDADVVITRGSPDGSQEASPSTAAMTWDNSDPPGRFSPRNPTGPYYGLLGRNTPVRVSVPAPAAYLRIEDDKLSYATAPDKAAFDITNDLEVQVEYDLSDWTGGAALARKWTTGTSQSWLLQLNPDGTVTFFYSTTGTDSTGATTRYPVPLGHSALRVVFHTDTGIHQTTVSFYTAPTLAGPWTTLDAVGPLAQALIFASTADVRIGWGLAGKFYAFKMLNGATVVASPDFTTAAAGAASLTDGQGNAWTLSGTAEFSDRDYRIHAECSGLPQSWDLSQQDIRTPVSASGLLRRVRTGGSSVDSALRRAIESKTGNFAPHAYWPCEDPEGSTFLASGIGGPPLRFNGPQRPNLASDTSFDCSLPIPVLNKSEWNGPVPDYTSHGSIVVRFLLSIPASPDAADDGPVLMRITTTGKAKNLFFHYRSVGALQLTGWDGEGTQLFDTGNAVFNVNGDPVWCSIEIQPVVGGGVQYSITTVEPGGGGLTLPVQTPTGTVGKARSIAVNTGNSITDIALGHITVQSQWQSLFDDAKPLNAWTGETAGNRFVRLCGENGFPARIIGYPDVTVAMGPQLPKNIGDLLNECAAADQGQIFEPRDSLSLGYRTLRSMCNQAPAVTLDYATQLSPPLEPTEDDQQTVNDVTATRPGGSSARVVLDDGSPMSIGVIGTYATSDEFPVADDDQLPDAAGWRLHVGSVDEPRYPVLTADLSFPALDPAGVLGVDIGDLVAVTDPPAWLPPGTIRQLVMGATETIGEAAWVHAWNTVPASPYDTAVVGDPLRDKVDTAGSSLHTAAPAGVLPATWGFENDPDPWGGSFAAVDISEDWAAEGRHSLKITASGTGTTFWQGFSPARPCAPGDTVAVTAVVYVPQALGNVHLTLHLGGGSDTFTDSPHVAIPAGGVAVLAVTAVAAAGQNFWQLAVVDHEASPAGTRMYTDLTAGAVAGTLQVDSTDTFGWTTNPADFPIDVLIGGELVTVAKITGTPPTQTWTVIRARNGVVKPQTAGIPVVLARPSIVALTG